MFPKCTDANNYDSKTNFKKDLINYLESYKDALVREWIEHVKSHDMTSAKFV